MAQTPGRTASSLRVEKDSRVFKLSVVSSCRSRRTSSSGDSRSLLFSERPSAFLTLTPRGVTSQPGLRLFSSCPPNFSAPFRTLKKCAREEKSLSALRVITASSLDGFLSLNHGSQSDSLLLIVVVLVSAANSQRDGASRFPSSSSLNFERKSFRNEGAHSS